MANAKISALTAVTVPATGDLVPIVDVSDTTDAATGTTKKITVTNLLTGDPSLLPNASTIAKGAVEEATQAEVDAQTAAGATGARLFINPSTTPIKASTTVMGAVEEAIQSEVDAQTAAGATGARLFINPSTSLRLSRVIKSMTAGATINGATLPVPVYQNKTDNEFYACDGNDTAAMKFLGFAISNGTDGGALTVQFAGIVSGFTGLSEGEKYYLSDTVGTISSTVGTYEVLVGVAISETELLIQKGRRFAAGRASFNSTTTSAITTGFRPTKVTVHALGGASDTWGTSHGSWSVSDPAVCIYNTRSTTTSVTSQRDDYVWFCYIDGTAGTNGNKGTVTTITDTGFTLDNVVEGTATVALYWEAEGEL